MDRLEKFLNGREIKVVNGKFLWAVSEESWKEMTDAQVREFSSKMYWALNAWEASNG